MASLLAGAGISAVGSLIGSGKQADAIKSAAQTQATAATHAADLTSAAEKNSLDFTKSVYGNAQGYESPYQATGAKALSQLGVATAPGGEFNSTPTGDQVLAQDPGYAFRLEQGQLALERGEAAGGSVGSGGALKAADEFGQNFASGEYENAFNRFNQTRQENYANLSNLAGLGANANATLTNAGTGAASNVSNTSLTGSNLVGGDLTQAANAAAAGAVGGANVWAGNLSNIGTALQQAMAASKSGYSGGGGGSSPTSNPGYWDTSNSG